MGKVVKYQLLRPVPAAILTDGVFAMTNKKWSSVVMVLVGNMIYALTVKLFVLPANLISCGTTGLALVVLELTGLPVSWFVLLFNIAMLCLGWAVLGRQFAMTTILSSILYPLFLEVLDRTLGDVRLTEDMLLTVLFAGLGLGLSLGIVLRAGASTGGMDIPPLILKRFFRIPVSASLWVFDLTIMLCQMFFHTAQDLLYGVTLLILISLTLNKVMLLGTSKTEVKIVSDKATAIRDQILTRVDRGVTLLHGEGGFRHQPTEVILSIVSNHELPKIERLARDIDPDCFMIVSSVTEVWGRGFSSAKHAGKHPTKK